MILTDGSLMASLESRHVLKRTRLRSLIRRYLLSNRETFYAIISVYKH